MEQKYYFDLKRLKGKYLRYFIAGFIDGVGSFHVSFSRHPSYKSGWIINTKFQVCQHEREMEIIRIIKEIFGTGRIRKKTGSNVVVFSIESRRSQIEKVIPFFQKYPLATKRKIFLQWKKVVEMIARKEHLTREGFQKIAAIVDRMNQNESAGKREDGEKKKHHV